MLLYYNHPLHNNFVTTNLYALCAHINKPRESLRFLIMTYCYTKVRIMHDCSVGECMYPTVCGLGLIAGRGALFQGIFP